MVEVGLEFSSALRRAALESLLDLPTAVAPTHFSEDEQNKAEPIADHALFLAAFDRRETGLLLRGPAGTFDISLAGLKPIEISCLLDLDADQARALLIHMSEAHPQFAFACAPDERECRNRVSTQLGANRIESWVGRDTQKYIPGLYWLTLLPETLAQQHHVSLTSLIGAASAYSALEHDQHLLQFYKEPIDWWRTDDPASHISQTRPGVFDIDTVKSQIEAAANFAELDRLLRQWR